MTKGSLGLCSFISEEFDDKAQTKKLAYKLVDIHIILPCNFNLKVSDPGKPFGQRNETVGETLQPDEDAVVKLVMTFQFGLDIVSIL